MPDAWYKASTAPDPSFNQKSTYYEKNNEYINAYVENWIIGYAKGHKEGRAEEKMAIARNMKNKGLPISDISEMTCLGVDEIEKL